MALTCGFYNSVDGDRKYDATQFASLFDGVITDGVVAAVGDFFATTPGGGMTVDVGTGRAWFNRTWTYSDAKIPLTLDGSDLLYDRIDAVVLEIDTNLTVRDNSIKVVKGTPAQNPKNPVLTNKENIHQYALAYVRVKAGSIEIGSGDITINVGQADCPFVTSIIETPELDVLFAQWTAQFETWFENVQSQLEGDIAANLQRQIDERVKIADKASEEDIINRKDDKWMTPFTMELANSSFFLNYNYIEFVDSVTWTVPEDIIGDLLVIAFGGGGGGGGSTGGGYGGGGGGGGHMTQKTVSVEPGKSIDVVIGAGGTGAADKSSSGSKGGTTKFGEYVTADGGDGGGNGNNSVGGHGGDGGTGGGGGYGSTGGRGGNATYGGGGGGGGGRGRGGNGGTYGGGGGTGRGASGTTAGGTGGTYGGNGGTGGSTGKTGENGTIAPTKIFNCIPSIVFSNGGLAGKNDERYDDTQTIGTGGGGYGGNGGNLIGTISGPYCGGSGGGGYGGNGGDVTGSTYCGGTGGGGYGGNGGKLNSSQYGGSGGGGYGIENYGSGGYGGTNGGGHHGKSGICVIIYFSRYSNGI